MKLTEKELEAFQALARMQRARARTLRRHGHDEAARAADAAASALESDVAQSERENGDE